MVSQKGYWEDGTIFEFEATVAAAEASARGLVVRLDKTYFYPESGGQLGDGGTVAGVEVVTAQQDDLGPYVVLPVGTLLRAGEHVACTVDAERRGRHTQLHSAQHILSRILDNQGIATLSFHMSDQDASIETSMPEVDERFLLDTEWAVECEIWRCLPVETLFVSRDDLGKYDVRKVPELREGPLRLVRIGDLDTNPCGGTHVRSTGEIGGFTITHTDKVRSNVRLYFVAGRTETAYRRRQRKVLDTLEGKLTCGLEDLSGAVDKLQRHSHELTRYVESLSSLVADSLRQHLLHLAAVDGVGVAVLDWVPAELAHAVIGGASSGEQVLCVVVYPDGGSEGHFVCHVPAQSPGLADRLGACMREQFGARCGGSSHVIQGKLSRRISVEDMSRVLQMAVSYPGAEHS